MLFFFLIILALFPLVLTLGLKLKRSLEFYLFYFIFLLNSKEPLSFNYQSLYRQPNEFPICSRGVYLQIHYSQRDATNRFDVNHAIAQGWLQIHVILFIVTMIPKIWIWIVLIDLLAGKPATRTQVDRPPHDRKLKPTAL